MALTPARRATSRIVTRRSGPFGGLVGADDEVWAAMTDCPESRECDRTTQAHLTDKVITPLRLVCRSEMVKCSPRMTSCFPPSLLAFAPLPPPPRRAVVLAVIGAGQHFRRAHLAALRWLADTGWPVRLAAAADPAPAARAACAKAFADAQLFSDGGEMLRKTPFDGVLVCTWPPLTERFVHEVVDRGGPQGPAIFAEKPLSLDLAGHARLAAKLNGSGCRLQAGYNRRYQPLARELAQRLVDLRGPRTVRVRFHRAARREPLFYEDILGHPLDLLRHWFGDFTLGNIEWHRSHTAGTIAPGLDFAMQANGVTVSAEVRPAIGRDLEAYEIEAAGTTLALTYRGTLKHASPAALVQSHNGSSTVIARGPDEGPDTPASVLLNGFVHQMAAFVRLAAGEEAGEYCTLADAEADCRLVAGLLAANKRPSIAI